MPSPTGLTSGGNSIASLLHLLSYAVGARLPYSKPNRIYPSAWSVKTQSHMKKGANYIPNLNILIAQELRQSPGDGPFSNVSKCIKIVRLRDVLIWRESSIGMELKNLIAMRPAFSRREATKCKQCGAAATKGNFHDETRYCPCFPPPVPLGTTHGSPPCKWWATMCRPSGASSEITAGPEQY